MEEDVQALKGGYSNMICIFRKEGWAMIGEVDSIEG